MYIDLNVFKQIIDVKLLQLHNNISNYLTVCKQMSLASFKNVINKICFQIM